MDGAISTGPPNKSHFLCKNLKFGNFWKSSGQARCVRRGTILKKGSDSKPSKNALRLLFRMGGCENFYVPGIFPGESDISEIYIFRGNFRNFCIFRNECSIFCKLTKCWDSIKTTTDCKCSFAQVPKVPQFPNTMKTSNSKQLDVFCKFIETTAIHMDFP